MKNPSIPLPDRCPTINELMDAVFYLKINKRTGIDKISFNVIKNCFEELSDLSLQTGKHPDFLKIAKVIPVFKTGDLEEVSNYRPISVLPCFLKILERIMHNRLYSYLVNENENDNYTLEILMIYPTPLTLLAMRHY